MNAGQKKGTIIGVFLAFAILAGIALTAQNTLKTRDLVSKKAPEAATQPTEGEASPVLPDGDPMAERNFENLTQPGSDPQGTETGGQNAPPSWTMPAPQIPQTNQPGSDPGQARPGRMPGELDPRRGVPPYSPNFPNIPLNPGQEGIPSERLPGPTDIRPSPNPGQTGSSTDPNQPPVATVTQVRLQAVVVVDEPIAYLEIGGQGVKALKRGSVITPKTKIKDISPNEITLAIDGKTKVLRVGSTEALP
ncbi:MAG: hypothetical protein MUC92_09645 [Fimbriimonadaceae bacterium]|jgi:hypothetical protein|nr:hypothetical protein [Fimbriimonadaceae bacterium]